LDVTRIWNWPDGCAGVNLPGVVSEFISIYRHSVQNANTDWTKKEDKLLGTMREDLLAKKLKRRAKNVTYRSRKLGIPRFFAPHWTKEHDALLGKWRDKKIARQLNQTPKAIEARRKRRDLLKVKPWTPAKDKLVGKMADRQLAPG
jgi:hypothetical protein